MTIETENPSTLASSSSNPYSSLFKEFRDHTIDRETFYTALYTQTLRDSDCFLAYHCQDGPEKPYQLKDSERKMLKTLETVEDNTERWKAKCKFYDQARERFKEFFIEQDTVKARNLSNRFFVEEMREYFHKRGNAEMVEEANKILRTYQS